MESAGHKTVGATGGGDGACSGGHLCHLCGYKYASAHPSAKQRRAHKKNCGVGAGAGGKSPPAAAATAEAEEERQGKKLLLDECEAEAGGGEGNGAGASDSGGGLPGSAQDVGNAVEDDANGVHSSPNGAGVQVIIDDVTSEVPPKANGAEIQSEVAMQLSENAPDVEGRHPSESHISADLSQDASASRHPSESHISADLSQDASASHCQSEPESGARISPDLSADEISKSNGVSLAPNAASDEISAQIIATVGGPDDVAFTEKDCMINIEEDKASEDMLVEDSEIVEGQSATTMENDLCANSLGVVSIKQIPSEETESKDESGVIRTDSVEQACTFKEPVNVLENKEPCTDKHAHTDDTSGDDLPKLNSDGCRLEPADVVETQQQTDPTSVVAEQLTNSKQTDLEEGQTYPDADEVIQATLGATGPAASTGDLTKKDPSEVITEEPSSDPTSHEINVISSKEDFEENTPNEIISADLTSHDRTEAQNMDTTTSEETKAVCSTDNIEEIKQIEQITEEANPLKSSILQNTSSAEEKEQTEVVIADAASYKVDVTSSRDVVVEKEHSDVCVATAQEINVVDIPANVELKKHNEETTRDAACEITNIRDNVEVKKQNEETTTDPAPRAISVIHSPGNDDKMQNEDMSEVPTSQANAVMDGTDNVEEKDEDPTSYNMDAVSAVDVVEVKKQEEDVTAEPTHPEIIAVHTVDSVKEKESEEPGASCKIDAGSNADSIPAVDPSSHENNTPQGTDDAQEKSQNEEATAVPAGDNIPAAESADVVAEKKQKGEAVTTESANGDQNEEITDKEMTIDSDKSHVSLKSLLSEKGTETAKEKKTTTTKDRVLSFRRRSSKDNPSPGKPGSVEQDWNSPARLPVEKSPKGKKQPWMPFICCHSMN